jgi:hypothetical protein
LETTLHRQLKARYGDQVEVTHGPFRADAIGPDDAWIEVQSGALGPLRPKLARLLPERTVRVVKPVIVERRIVKRARRDGRDLSARLSPRRGSIVDFFDDFLGIAKLFPHSNLSIEVLAVAIDEVRVPRKRWPGYAVVDRALREIRRATLLEVADDLWALLPEGLPEPFTTVDLAELLNCPVSFAQRVAYGLRHAGAAKPRDKRGNRVVYRRGDGEVEFDSLAMRASIASE